MKQLENKIPPVVIFLLCASAMWWLAANTPRLPLPDTLRWTLAGAAVILASCLGLAGIVSFKKARTTVNPHTPEAVSSLVSQGVYQFSRNPMYTAMVIMLLALALYWASLPALVGIPVFMLYLTHFQIKPEERALEAAFKEEFINYRKRVRRWL